jgi:hypothetical protein
MNNESQKHLEYFINGAVFVPDTIYQIPSISYVNSYNGYDWYMASF